jgi:predicted 2-oxoglutarate/Fe(II)-dependent dioxygenase YbiX
LLPIQKRHDRAEESPLSKNILEELSQALSKIDRPGTFCVSGSVQTVLPGLEVQGLGPISLPLTGAQAKELKALCEQAPYGKGEKTLVDTSVRRVSRLRPSQFTLKNPEWQLLLRETLKKVQEELGLEKQKLESHLHEILLYEAGSFFLPHRDGEKLDRMVATLVIVLPASYEGGELVVRHEGQEQTIDFSSVENSALQTHFAAFYADCEHEVRPLRKGFRLCLVYNLTLAKSKKPITAPRNSEHIQRIIPLLREWSEDNTVRKLAITLDHQYTKDGLAWDKLKGADRVKARVLAEAARQVDCKAYLALLTFWESGSAEGDGDYGYGYGSHSRWYDEDEDEDEEDDGEGVYEMGEVFESSLSAEHWSDSAGHSLPIGVLRVEEDELLDPDLLREVTPEEEFEGYTGNAGMTLDRWYRHAAIILWPARTHFEVLCDDDSRKVLPVLEQMVARWKNSTPEDAPIQKSQCIGLATAILTQWPESPRRNPQLREGERNNLLKALVALGDTGLIGRLLGEVMIKDAAVDPGKSLVEACQNYGWDTFRHELEALFKSTTIENLERNVRLLEDICLSRPRNEEGWAELCKTASRDLVSALEAIDGEKGSRDWRSSELHRAQLLSGLARALSVTGQPELLSEVVSHALALPEKYPLRIAHLPAIISIGPWLKQKIKISASGLLMWVAACREQLEHLTAEAPREPTDFRRVAAISCKCADCAELKRFLEDPHEAARRFSMRQDRRSHLEEKIRQHKYDLNTTTERTRSPHTLVCTKNKASYQEKLRTYRQDQQSLAEVISIQESLPQSTTSRARQGESKPKSRTRQGKSKPKGKPRVNSSR